MLRYQQQVLCLPLLTLAFHGDSLAAQLQPSHTRLVSLELFMTLTMTHPFVATGASSGALVVQ